MASKKNIRNISARLDDETRKKFKYVAQYDNRSMNNMVSILVQQCIRQFEQEHGPITAEELSALDEDEGVTKSV